MNLLIGEISSYKAIVTAKFINEKYPHVRIYTYDSRKLSRKLHTKYSEKHFVLNVYNLKKICEIIDSHNIDLFFPVISNNIKHILRNKSKFNHSLVYMGDYETFCILNDKSKLMALSSQQGIRIPKTYNSVAEGKLPLVVKPRNLSSAEGVIYIKTKEDLKNYLKLENSQGQNNYIVQEYIEGTGVGYSAYVKKGEIITGYGHKRLAEHPISGGSSVYRETYYDPRMKGIAEQILGDVTWTGFAMFEFKLTNENELILIEVNPRIWGSINQGLQNGVNYFSEIFGDVQLENFQENRTYLSPLIYYSLFKYMMQSNFKPIIYFLKNLKSNTPDVSLFDDPKGFFSMILRKVL